MKNQLVAKLETDHQWLPEQTDLSHCTGCGEVIYSRMYRLWLVVVVTLSGFVDVVKRETDTVICESCNNLLE